MSQGVALALAVLLAGAGLPKLWRPDHVAGALRRVFVRRTVSTAALRRAGQALGLWELLLAAAMVVLGGHAVGIAAAATFLGFLGFVVAAVRRGASCGCWASLTEGPAGGAELARTAVLAAGAAHLAVAGWSPGFGWASAGWAAAFLALMAVAATAGGRVAPVRSARVARRLAQRAAPTRRGRLAARLAFLLGFVHAGTDTERRRYLDALAAARAAGPIPREREVRADAPSPPGTRARTRVPEPGA
ncbi:MauE/DoxX family redox-associated membrane protein [Actinophytocola sp.]|uniref:MauE/DoxX family redox-associated membrane protein n=1 Tax=Actinophytocola sp. TaxID=1872138 RepID=UPI002D324703|nr:MauE/DoxX family redox-associated membrane protein [Actinophytocola sp.]HYQ68373.1 MauE/DoxX family redox-associated membrane protein [Actinophytocola sp.]